MNQITDLERTTIFSRLVNKVINGENSSTQLQHPCLSGAMISGPD